MSVINSSYDATNCSLDRAEEHTILLRVEGGAEAVNLCASALASDVTLGTTLKKVLPLDDGKYVRACSRQSYRLILVSVDS